MKDSLKNILIGLFVSGAIVTLISMILFLDPKVGDGKKSLKVRFANISGIEQGTRVSYAGKPVGEVVSIHEIPHARSEQLDDTGKIYCYLLHLKLDSSVSVYDTDEIAIRSIGLMGEKSIAILPKTALPGRSARLITDETVIANSIDPLENTFNLISKTATRMETTLAEFNQWFKTNEQPLTHTVSTLNHALERVDTLFATIEQEKIVPSIHQSSDLLNEFLGKVSTLADSLHNTAEILNTDGADTLHNLHLITQDIVTGTGTLGKVIGQEDLYLRVNSLLSKAETLMNDVNHYGLLFQYDKHWQRSRTKRANILQSLSSAKEFRAYFEYEMDAMNTSLGRLTQLLDKAEGENERASVAANPDFKKQFANFLRQVESLKESIKLYNEGLVAEIPEE
jgi:phospholipid/cholesterol/gamma-HCH transport system substrate-binding protein